MGFRRAWDGAEWQAFALKLVQLRHGSSNVQIVPDKVQGDAGLEFFTTDGCLYQCYAPQEVSDVKKASSAMKAKASRDLGKLAINEAKISQILSGLAANRWILLCPFLDDKAVVASVRGLGVKTKAACLSFLTHDFEALCHSQNDFLGEIQQLEAMSIGPPLQVAVPTAADIAVSGTSIGVRIKQKLERAYGHHATPAQITNRRDAFIKAHLYRENALNQLRQNHAVLWERVFLSIDAEETRLIAVGASSTLQAGLLEESMHKIEISLTKALPTITAGIITQIALGTVSDWLIRCPLDFPDAI